MAFSIKLIINNYIIWGIISTSAFCVIMTLQNLNLIGGCTHNNIEKYLHGNKRLVKSKRSETV